MSVNFYLRYILYHVKRRPHVAYAQVTMCMYNLYNLWLLILDNRHWFANISVRRHSVYYIVTRGYPSLLLLSNCT